MYNIWRKHSDDKQAYIVDGGCSTLAEAKQFVKDSISALDRSLTTPHIIIRIGHCLKIRCSMNNGHVYSITYWYEKKD